MDKPEKRSDKRREDIIRVATKFFANKGYHGTKINEIARELGISKPALYYHVGDKQKIFREIINKVMEPMDISIRIGDSNLPPKKKVEEIIRTMIEYCTKNREIALLGIEEAKTLPPRSQRSLRRRQKEIEKVLQRTLQDGMEQGDFNIEDVRMVSFTILAAANWVSRWYHVDGDLTPEEIVQQITRVLEHGFIKR